VRYNNKGMKAHRLMCLLAHGEPPTNKHQVAHSCGKGSEGCVNPRHIRWATSQENIDDKEIHGTNPKGERNAGAKLTEESVLKIRSLARTITYGQIAKIFGVSCACVSAVVRRVRWRHI
jgi:hypothetical protein